jgi:predicted peptidase
MTSLVLRRLAALSLGLAACASLALVQPSLAQPAPVNGPTAAPPLNGPPRGPMRIDPDPRVQQRTYAFAPTGEEMKYTLYVSSKVKPGTPAPLIVALHGLGGDSNFIVRDKLVDLAEEGGYVVVGPMGYNVGGWYGSPLIQIGNLAPARPNLTELSELDVMTVLQIARSEFNIDPDRIYLMGHSMGGAGTLFLGQKHADYWAAVAAIAPAAFMMQRDQKDILAPLKAAHVPVMITQGDQDPVVPAANTRTWAAAMDELGMEHEYVEMPGRDHGTIIWDGMPEIFRYFAEHKRPPRPAPVPPGRPPG